MATRSASKRRRQTQAHVIVKPRGVLHPRVQKVGPEHFGILCIDCAKRRSKAMLADFYGRVLLPPMVIEHNQAGFATALQSVRAAIEQHSLKDLVVAIERTGRYHRAIQHAFAKAGFEVRIVHPYTTKQYRQPADPGNKTDDTDLAAIHRATVNGLSLLESEADPVSVRLQMLARRRRELVETMITLRNRIHDHLHAIMPGYAQCFVDIFDCQIPLQIAKDLGSAAAILKDGVLGLTQRLQQANRRAHAPTLEKIVAWARSAAASPESEEQATLHRRFLGELDEDRLSKLENVRRLEGELAALLVQTPYVLLLAIPGINVVSASEFAGEMGPIARYTRARAITGRAGLYPSRYQSDQVDRRNGALVRHGNRQLRSAILRIAGNLITCNDHFRILAAQWRLQGKDARDIHVRVAGRFCRIAYHVVAGRTAYQHPCSQKRHSILEKLITFYSEHAIDSSQLMRDLDAAVALLPRHTHREEAASVVEELAQVQRKRGAEPRRLGEVLPAVLAKLGVNLVRSSESGEADPT